MFEEHPIGTGSAVLPHKGKLRWNCRRGMKELEVLLLPFVDEFYDDLLSEQQHAFVKLLGYDDASLYAWFMGYEIPESVQLQKIIQEVQCAVANMLSGQTPESREDAPVRPG